MGSAQARLWKARAFFFPELTAKADWTHRDHETTRVIGGEPVVIQSRDGVQTTTAARLTVFDARAFPTWRAARRDRDATARESADAKRGIAFETAEAFLAVLGVQQVREAADRRLALSRQALDEAKARFDAKLVASTTSRARSWRSPSRPVSSPRRAAKSISPDWSSGFCSEASLPLRWPGRRPSSRRHRPTRCSSPS